MDREAHTQDRQHTDCTGSAAAQHVTLDSSAASDVAQHPELVLALLETDQTVAAKQRTRFGLRLLSRRERLLLWALRVYVLLMLAIVLFAIFRAAHIAQ